MYMSKFNPEIVEKHSSTIRLPAAINPRLSDVGAVLRPLNYH